MQKNCIILNFKVYFILHSGFNHHILQNNNYPKDSGIDSEKNIHHLKKRHEGENGKYRHHSLKLMGKKPNQAFNCLFNYSLKNIYLVLLIVINIYRFETV